ncbi:hypothetical protein BD410DRAFT_790860 [Rickenella mellea]|uniref:Uncharacterized protein n=1 Tax=Rickenella mellea TaxID=50990 RepID=A0A4Y7Q0K1_9AGAM|nr:hypothetical protein BD410DRAFT_790860 [Rickenella mellea]
MMRNRLLLSVVLVAFITWTIHWRAAEVLGRLRSPSSADPGSASFELIQYQPYVYMGDDAVSFNDEIEIYKLTGKATNITKISRIVVFHGPAIGALTITYQLSNRNEYTSKQHGFVWSALHRDYGSIG